MRPIVLFVVFILSLCACSAPSRTFGSLIEPGADVLDVTDSAPTNEVSVDSEVVIAADVPINDARDTVSPLPDTFGVDSSSDTAIVDSSASASDTAIVDASPDAPEGFVVRDFGSCQLRLTFTKNVPDDSVKIVFVPAAGAAQICTVWIGKTVGCTPSVVRTSYGCEVSIGGSPQAGSTADLQIGPGGWVAARCEIWVDGVKKYSINP